MRILVTGAAGGLGTYVVETLALDGTDAIAWGRARGAIAGVGVEGVDLEMAGWETRLDAIAPDVILHLAALSAAESVRLDPERGRRVNVEATRRLAAWCGLRDCRLVFTSTDLVFDGSKPWNREDDPAEPVLAYGRTKRTAEPFVTAAPRGLVARVSLLFGPSRNGREAYFDRILAALSRGEPQTLFEDEYRTPLDLAAAARILIELGRSDASGIIHVAGRERMSRFDLIRRAAATLGLDPSLVLANRRADATLPEPRPADVSLDTSRLAALLPGIEPPTVEEAIARFNAADETRDARTV
ncbi:MAG TPA: SDR family oxidoreductase [Isosphaeraceae bacterium]